MKPVKVTRITLAQLRVLQDKGYLVIVSDKGKRLPR